MKRASYFAVVVVAVVVCYVIFGALTQMLQGALDWKSAVAVVGMAAVFAALLGVVAYGVAQFFVRKVFGNELAQQRYLPGRAVLIASAVVIVLTTAYAVGVSYSVGAAQVAAANKIRLAREAESARFAALTPEQQAAEIQQKREKAAAAAKVAAEKAAQRKADQEAKEAETKHRDAQLQFAAVGIIEIKNSMKDPDTFELKSAYVTANGTACYEYRAVNSFGAKLRGSAVMTPAGKILLSERDENRFVRAWNAECTKSGGDDIAPLLERLGTLKG